jgi:hypothetical protein
MVHSLPPRWDILLQNIIDNHSNGGLSLDEKNRALTSWPSLEGISCTEYHRGRVTAGPISHNPIQQSKKSWAVGAEDQRLVIIPAVNIYIIIIVGPHFTSIISPSIQIIHINVCFTPHHFSMTTHSRRSPCVPLVGESTLYCRDTSDAFTTCLIRDGYNMCF